LVLIKPNDALQLLLLASVAVIARGCVPAAAVRVVAHGAVNKGERSTLCPNSTAHPPGGFR